MDCISGVAIKRFMICGGIFGNSLVFRKFDFYRNLCYTIYIKRLEVLRMGYIYSITHITDNKKYIGQTIDLTNR